MASPVGKATTGSTILDLFIGLVRSSGLVFAASLGGIKGWIFKMILNSVVKGLTKVSTRVKLNEEGERRAAAYVLEQQRIADELAKPNITPVEKDKLIEERRASDAAFLAG